MAGHPKHKVSTRTAFARWARNIRARQLLLRAAVSAAFGVFVLWLNPLDIGRKSDEASSAVFQRILAPLIQGRNRSNPVVVVLFTPMGLERVRRKGGEAWSWPVPFAAEAHLLDKLVPAKPRSVFFDLAFYQAHDEGIAQFADAIAKATQTSPDDRDAYIPLAVCGARDPWRRLPAAAQTKTAAPVVPIFLAEASNSIILQALCAAGAEGVGVDWTSAPNAYPFAGMQRYDDPPSPAAPPPSTATARPGDTPAPNGRKTAAFRMFEHWCFPNGPVPRPTAKCFFQPRDAIQGDARTKAHDTAGPVVPNDAYTRPPLNLTWDLEDNPEQRDVGYDDLYSGSCEIAFPNFGARLDFLLVHLLTSDVWEKSPHYAGCTPPPLTVPATEVLHPEFYGKNASQVAQFLKDKFVVVGADFPGMRDRVLSPVYGSVPGAYAHAVALENLLKMGSSYYRVYPDTPWWLQIVNFFVVTVVLFATLLFLERDKIEDDLIAKIAHDRRRSPWKAVRGAFADLGQCALALIGLMIVLFAISYVLFVLCRIAPLNWLGMALLVAVSSAEEIAMVAVAVSVALLMLEPHCRNLARHFVDPPKKEDRNHA